MCQQVNAIVNGFFCLFLAGLDLNLQGHSQLQKACHFWNVFVFRTFKRNKSLSWTIKLSENLRFVGIIIKAASTRAICTKSVVKVGSYLKIKSYPNLFIILTEKRRNSSAERWEVRYLNILSTTCANITMTFSIESSSKFFSWSPVKADLKSHSPSYPDL